MRASWRLTTVVGIVGVLVGGLLATPAWAASPPPDKSDDRGGEPILSDVRDALRRVPGLPPFCPGLGDDMSSFPGDFVLFCGSSKRRSPADVSRDMAIVSLASPVIGDAKNHVLGRKLVNDPFPEVPIGVPLDGTPSSCKTDAGKGRRDECVGYTFNFGMFNKETKAVGTGSISMLYWQDLDTRGRKWQYSYKLKVDSLTEKLQVGTEITPVVSCTQACAVAGSSTRRRISQGDIVENKADVSSPRPAISTSEPQFALTVTNPIAINTAAQSLPQMDKVRCDSDPTLAQGGFEGDEESAEPVPPGGSNGGCSFSNNIPVFVINQSPPLAPQHALFVQRAQQKLGGVGTRASGIPLHRSTDRKRTRQNGDEVCPASWPRRQSPPGTPRPLWDSCDEYPYRSTKEGGKAKPEDGKPYAAETDHVPLGDNSNGGFQLGNFYTHNRLIDGDPFYVQPMPTP